MTINEIQNEISEEFDLFDDWMDKYDHIITFGKEIELLDESAKTDENLVRGCQSKVWLVAEEHNGKIIFKADSDAIITKGIIGLLIRILSNQAAQAIVDAELFALERIGLKDHLSPNRANGLASMIKKMKLYALGHSSKA
jgi:cysteine desulfuration protein SufE